MKKSMRSRLVDIPKAVKLTVYERDKGSCIICGKQGVPNAHYISRARGGLGIEQNIVTLCPKCHYDYDFSNKHKVYGDIIEDYLKEKYPEWNKKSLYFKKWSDFSNE